MTARQRQAPGSAAVSHSAESPSANGIVNGQAAAFRWEEWFAGASPDQRAEALALARQQGLLYLQQLPSAHNRTRHNAAAEPTLVPFLTRLLAGKAEAMPALADEPLDWSDDQLDALQREAVRRALNTPDVCLLRGLPGTGKTRVVAETIVQAARRGWRVLLLAPTACAVDAVLERLAGCADVLPIRLLAADEATAALSATVRSMTLPEQRRQFRERSLQGARQARRQADQTCLGRQREASLWPQLLPLAERYTALETRLRGLEQHLASVNGEVEREAAGLNLTGKGMPSGPFAAEVLALHQRFAAALAASEDAHKQLASKHEILRKENDAFSLQVAAVQSRCKAREEGRWWTIAYWTAGSALQERDTLQAQQQRVETALRELGHALAELLAERQQIDAKHDAERRALIGGETQRRQDALSADLAAVQRERAELEQSWHALCAPLEPAELRPVHISPAEIEAARERWQRQCRRDEEGCQFARQWADYLDTAGDQLLPRLPALANLLAGPTAALARGHGWSEAGGSGWDLLIIEEAEAVSETELLRLAAHAPRLLLVGHSAGEAPATAAPGKGTRSLPGLQSLPACWARLWQGLADDLGRLPYTWLRAGERLVCHLASVRPEDERHLEREGLADAPEIELYILNLPRCRPVLARVSFPGHFSIPEATAFIYRELEELPIQPLGRTAWWQETPNACIVHLGPVPDAPLVFVDLGGGVRMGLIADEHAYAGRAARLEFARAAAWDRAGARRWLDTKLQVADRERSVFLQVPHRMARPLAEVVGPLLFPESCLANVLRAHAATESPFEFVAVPAARQAGLPHEGAGLEQDLSAGRHGDRVPSELRAELPRKGLVNYLEAQALIRRLERWVQAPAELGSHGKGGPSVLVLALYEAQAEMLRRLTARSPILKGRSFALEIAVPGQARHRECDVLVLSLTRSHAHRCVPFGEDTADLPMALTRARQRVLVFGDLGTLAKRTTWQGPLDHLDAPQAHQEGVHLTRLLQQVHSVQQPEHSRRE